MQTLETVVKQLPLELKEEVEDFVEFLLKRQSKKPRKKLKMNWAGVLKDIKDQYASVDLQHKISKWRIGEK